MSVYAPSADYLWELTRCAGLDPEQVFKDALIDPALRFDSTARIPQERMNALHERISSMTGDDTIGLRARSVFHPSHLGPLGYAWLASPDLRSALGKVRRYSSLAADAFVLTLVEQDDEMRVEFSWEADNWQPIPSQVYLVSAMLMHLCRMLLGEDLVPDRVAFSTAPPAALDPFRRFFGCRPTFDDRHNLIVLPLEATNRPLPSAHAELERVTSEVVVRYLADRKRADIVSLARAKLFELLPEARADVESVARGLNVSTRTLRRRLDDGGYTFRSLLSEVRHELALRYVRDRTLTLTEISYLLGFSEPSAFSRAYRGWTGASPSQARSSLA